MQPKWITVLFKRLVALADINRIRKISDSNKICKTQPTVFNWYT
jgi:hypothetical protein